MAKKKEEEFTYITVNIERDLYFKLIAICLRERKTLDEICSEALNVYATGILNGTIKLPTKAQIKALKK